MEGPRLRVQPGAPDVVGDANLSAKIAKQVEGLTFGRSGVGGGQHPQGVLSVALAVSAEGFDRSQVANVIGVFSNDVEVLDQRIRGQVAVVTVQVAGRVPLDEVKLLRREDRWLIQTDPPIPGVADELRRLAQVLLDAARMLDKQAMTPVELKKELDLREASIGRRITALTRKPPP